MAGTLAKFAVYNNNVSDELYLSRNPSVSIMEQDVVLDQLFDHSFQKRSEILDQLRTISRRNGGRLPFQDQRSIFKGFADALGDSNWDVRHQCIQLINELIPRMGSELDECMAVVLPKLIPNIGDRITIRKAVIQTVHVYMKYTQDINSIFHGLVVHGLENGDSKVRRETTIALPMLFTREFTNENFNEIISALAKQLIQTSSNVDDNIAQPSLMSLERIRTLVGEETFERYLQKLPSSYRKYYCKLTNRKDDFDSRTSSTTDLSDTPKRFSVNPNSSTNTPKHSVSNTPATTPTIMQRQNTTYEFGVVPSHIMSKLNDQNDFRNRATAVEELKHIIAGLPDCDLLEQHMVAFISFLNNLLDDPNFKITTVTLEIIHCLIGQLDTDAKKYYKPILAAVMKRMGESKIVVRQFVAQVVMRLMVLCPPAKVVSVICENLSHRNSRVRQESLNMIIAALTLHPSYDFKLADLCQIVGPALVDPKRQVRHAALECYAMLAQAIGNSKLSPLVQAVDNVELNYDGEGVMAAVQARLARRILPKVTPDGMVEYALTIPSSGSSRSNISAAGLGADLEWIMQAQGGGGSARSRGETLELESVPNSARSTPSLPQDSPTTTGPSPRRFLSAGRGKSKLPWEEERDDRIDEHPSSAPQSRPLKTDVNTPPFKPRTTWGEESVQDSTIKKSGRRKTGSSSRDESPDPGGRSYKQIHLDKIRRRDGINRSLSTTYPGRENGEDSPGNAPMSDRGGILSSTSSPVRRREPRRDTGSMDDILNEDPNGFGKSLFGSSSGFTGKEVKDLSSSWPEGKRLELDIKSNKPILDPISAPETPVFPKDWEEPFETRREINDPSPIPLKATIARGSASKRKVPPIPSKEPSPRDDYDTDSAYGPSLNSTGEHPSNDELNTSLRQIRNSASKKRAEKLFEKLEKKDHAHSTSRSPSPPDDDLDESGIFDKLSPREELDLNDSGYVKKSRQLGSPFDKPRLARRNEKKKSQENLLEGNKRNTGDYNPNSGVTFRENKSSDVKVVGKGYAEDAVVAEPRPSPANKQARERRRMPKGSTLSPLGMASIHSHGSTDIDNDRVPDQEGGFNVIGRGPLESLPENSVEKLREITKQPEEGRKPVKRRMSLIPLPVTENRNGVEDQKSLSLDTNDNEDKKTEDKKMKEIVLTKSNSRRNSKQELLKTSQPSNGMFDQPSQENNHSNGSREPKRKHSKQDINQNIPDVRGVGVKQGSHENGVDRSGEESDDESISMSMSQTMRGKIEQMHKEAEEKKAQKEKERAMREEQERIAQEEEQLRREEEHRRKEVEKRRREEERRRRLEEKKQQEKERQMEKLKKLPSEDSLKSFEALSISGSGSNTMPASPRDTPTKPPIGKPPTAGTPPRKKSKSPPTYSPKDRKISSAAEYSPNSTLSSSMRPMSESTELKPCHNPDNALREAQSKIAQDEWETKCDGLILIRRLAMHHSEVLCQQLHPVILAVIAEIKNLRSQVSRLAITTMGDMFTYLKKNMDSDLDSSTKILLHKTGETSGFIREDVERSLQAMVDGVTPQRALVALIAGGASHKNNAVRKSCANYLSILVDKMGPGRILSGVKDVTDRVLPVVANFVVDSTPETRYYGRKILFSLMSHQEFDKTLSKHLTANQLRNIKDIVDNLRTKGLGEAPSETPSAKTRRSGQGSRSRDGSAGSSHGLPPSLPSSSSSKKRPKIHINEQTQESVKEMCNNLAAADWQKRLEGLETLCEMTEECPDVVSTNIIKILDKFAPTLKDSNSKVNLYALQVMLQITPSIRDSIGNSVNMIVQAVAVNLQSKNKEINSTAMSVLDMFMEHIDHAILLQPFANQAQAGNARVKPDMIEKVSYLVSLVYNRKPKQVVLHVLPLVWHLLGTSTGSGAVQGGSGSIRAATAKLVTSLHEQMGQSLLDQASAHLSPRNFQQLQDMLES